MARAVFSDRVRLLWSDVVLSPAAPNEARNYSSVGGGGGRSFEAGRWPSPGPARRPLHIPWRVRHFLAYSRRPTVATPGHAAKLDIMLVRFKEVGCKCLTFTMYTSETSVGVLYSNYHVS